MFDKLKQVKIVGSIVVMPDFFIDRIIQLDSTDKLFDSLMEKARHGGGSVRGIPTYDVKGGNAVNVAYFLATLGIKVTLFTVADEYGSAMLRQAFSPFGDKADLRIISGKHGFTTSFEFPYENSKVNVMISDIKDNKNFGPDRISSDSDRAVLKNADAVMVVNWASNLKGTELADHVFRNSPSALHFIDPADIETRKHDFKNSLAKLASVTDALSINENECSSLADALGLGSIMPASGYTPDEVKNAAKQIAQKTGIGTDLHTRIGAAWSNGRESEFAHAINVEAKSLTGAGDAWDAADIIGYLAGLDPRERLQFSNACASLYVRSDSGKAPTMESIYELLDRIR